MIFRPAVLCPIDFSESSRGALRYAAAIAAHFGARLTLLAVNDPLLQEADEFAGVAHLTDDTRRDVERFVSETFRSRPHGVADVRLEVTTGKPAPEILRVSREKQCDLIVMSSHGLTGFRKLFFGSTTERVLRETSVPVLVTPGSDAGPARLEDIPQVVRRVLVPVDLTAATPHQLRSHGASPKRWMFRSCYFTSSNRCAPRSRRRPGCRRSKPNGATGPSRISIVRSKRCRRASSPKR